MMRHLITLAALAAVAAAIPTPASAQTIGFGDTSVGALPKDFATALTGQGQPGRWEVVEDTGAAGGRALAQLSPDGTDYRFPLAIHQGNAPADVEVTTRFKSVSGKVDQAAGLAVRLVDHNNYYVARANALEDNVRFYRMVKGRRQELAGANLKVASGQWHTLTLRARGNRFAVSFDGKPLFTHTDATFAGAGKVALWTKADSVMRFERLEIKPLP